MFTYTPPWVIVFILLVLPVGLFILSKTTRRRELRMRLCTACDLGWRRGAWIARVSGLACLLAVLIGGGAATNGFPVIGCTILVAGIVAVVWAALRRNEAIVRASIIDADDRIHLLGLHPSVRALIATPTA